MDHSKPHPEFYNVPWATDSFNGMPYRSLGRSGLRVSNVGLGTWKIGYPRTGDGARVDEKAAWRIFDRAIECGVTFWDTANRYNGASGNSERIIGRWFRSNPEQRRNVVLATKVFGGMDGRTPNHSGLSRLSIMESVYACLERLQVESVDVLYFHAFDPVTPIEESLAAVEDLMRQDIVRYLAVSNFSVAQLNEYRKASGAFSRCCVLAVQNQFDILNGEGKEHSGVLGCAAKTGVSFVAWSPLARGLLSEKYLEPAKASRGDRLIDEGDLVKVLTPETLATLRRLAVVARELGLTLTQLALAYMLTLPGMGPVIPSATSVEQVEANAAAGKVVLSEAQRRRVRDALAGPGRGRARSGSARPAP
ncbi:MAG: aryl-alcohol dehydrogenase [Lentisphaerae bacterium RIFOXYB12_FULL_65_16]|nr:MAG: aryl-alcohol dehydrogenase [Lentisphaerae bacterium RIFOXYA12_64_32]OGV90509.1 MAG: aryl-alcohol dehydrogenase [Lentisphaerae bacterium RIFOXYB12_FULL_65_16]